MNSNELFGFLKASPDHAEREDISEEEDGQRTKFCRDRDRLLYSKEFRRLEGKTQVFVNGFDDHIRNRLTHTLEVSQIAQSLARCFNLNLNLVEAISFGHDVGHAPFGHVGERELNYFANNCYKYKDFSIAGEEERGFKHNLQGVKVVSTLEKISPDYPGLNLTDYTRWGILNHSDLKYKKCEHLCDGECYYRHDGKKCHLKNNDYEFYLTHYDQVISNFNQNSWSFEALIVSYADEIAQRHHDIEDGLIAGVLDKNELHEKIKSCFENYLDTDKPDQLNMIFKNNNINYIQHDLSSFLIRLYSSNLIFESTKILSNLIKEYKIRNQEEFNAVKNEITKNSDIMKLISYDEEFSKADKTFQNYLYNRILNSHLAQTMDGKASFILRNNIKAYLSNPKQLPDATIGILMKNFDKANYTKIYGSNSPKLAMNILRDQVSEFHNGSDDKFKTALIRTIIDFIAGMTDQYAIDQNRMLYGTDNYWMK
ncbi:MAG: dNTP triphosphohydrolase [Bacteroidales bacterium]|nr:dNTP triphosphohydrolase [Bacteroidales bacterium]